MLGPLAFHGGLTRTHALLPGSDAIDSGDDPACPAVDQRGVGRPKGDGCDIGAYEFQPGAIAWGDNDCDGALDADDAISSLAYAPLLGPLSGQCPEVGAAVDIVDGPQHTWGDVNCDGVVDALDALSILLVVAGLPALEQTEPCPEVGEEVLLD
jgi:hypothetical protein